MRLIGQATGAHNRPIKATFFDRRFLGRVVIARASQQGGEEQLVEERQVIPTLADAHGGDDNESIDILRLHGADDVLRAVGADGRFLERLARAQRAERWPLALVQLARCCQRQDIASGKRQIVVLNWEPGGIAHKCGDGVSLFKGLLDDFFAGVTGCTKNCYFHLFVPYASL